MSKPRLLLYCQHLLGIGHLSRSLAIAKACVERGFSVDFVQGGPDIGRAESTDAALRFVKLAPLLMDEDTNRLYDPEGTRPVEEIFLARAATLRELCRENVYDLVLTELFPFGRNKFKGEVLALLHETRRANPRVQSVSSVRDILVGREDGGEWEAKVVRILKENFDHVLVHSDPGVLLFDETFRATPEIADRLHYTGFVSDAGGFAPGVERRPEILVSLGGGAVGEDLARAVLDVSADIPRFRFRFFLGPYAAPALLAAVEEKVSAQNNVTAEGFLPVAEFGRALSRAALSISLAGYNTLMDLVSTRTPALVFPYAQNHEQNLRARRFADREQLTVLTLADFSRERLGALIQAHVMKNPPRIDLLLNGAAESARLLENWAGGH